MRGSGGIRLLYGAILIGGAIGGVLRYLLGFASNLAPSGDSSLVVTLLINLGGSLLLGVLYASGESRKVNPVVHKGLGVGVLGAFTTFSTFCSQATALAPTHLLLAVIYVIVTMLLGPAFAFIGEKVTVLWFTRSEPTTEEWSA